MVAERDDEVAVAIEKDFHTMIMISLVFRMALLFCCQKQPRDWVVTCEDFLNV
jgi:hypothetical protein